MGRFGGVMCDAGIRSHALRASIRATLLLGALAGKRLGGLLEACACNAGDVEVALAVESGLRREGSAGACFGPRASRAR